MLGVKGNNNMKIAVAQIRPIKGDIPSNIEKHQQLIRLAISHKVDALFFPELSITSYEPKLAQALASHQSDKAFDSFQEISYNNNITIGVGMPKKTSAGIKISMFIFQPNQPRKAYSKQQLHSDELSYFIKGEKQIIITIDDIRIAPAICYESLLLSHFESAVQLGAEIYVASVAKSQNGINKAMTHYSAMAKKCSMSVFMSNCVGFCDNFESVGQSAVWTKQGNLAGQLNSTDEGILIFDTKTEEVFIQII